MDNYLVVAIVEAFFISLASITFVLRTVIRSRKVKIIKVERSVKAVPLHVDHIRNRNKSTQS